ncbi:MAG TPA: hypothetical protein VH519_14915 [Hyphomicrobiaceae bacterium]
MPDIDWIALGLLVACVLLAVLYGLAASGHFPAHVRSATLRRGWGAFVLWGTLVATALATGAAGLFGWRALPWPAAVIGGGVAMLFAPLLLQSLPDSFVNGRRALLVLSMGTVILAVLMWRVAGSR